MIKGVFLVVFLLLPIVGNTQVLVKSGEHDGFTRLVMNYQEDVAWQLGRIEGGYELEIERGKIEYDFSEVYQRIGKNRLAAIWTDDANGRLHFSLACACHAKAFRFRSGVIVVDISDGAAPLNSTFELPISSRFNKEVALDLESEITNGVEKDDRYNWIEDYIDETSTIGEGRLPELKRPRITQNLQISEIRSRMLTQLSRGASLGVIEIDDIPKTPRAVVSLLSASSSWHPNSNSVGLGFNEMPGVLIEKDLVENRSLSSDGNLCIDSSSLDVASWRTDAPVWHQIGSQKDGMLQEFDIPNSAVVAKSVKFLLSIGFGSEARRLMESFPTDTGKAKLWRAISYIVDGERDPDRYFTGQSECATAAAFWSTMDSDDNGPPQPINGDAVVLEFSSLPIEMRTFFGARLIKKLLKKEMPSTAEKIKNAIIRSPDAVTSEKLLIEASLDLFHDRPIAAERKGHLAFADPGPKSWSALVTMIDAKAAQNTPLEADLLIAIEALSRERLDAENQADIRRAVILAHALTGDFRAAFLKLPSNPDTSNDLWRLLSILGTDDDILKEAVLSDYNVVGLTDKKTKERIATRLTDLGMTWAGLAWNEGKELDEKSKLASMFLLQGDASSVLSIARNTDVKGNMEIRALALQKLGRVSDAAELFSKGKDVARELSALRQMDDWDLTRGRSPEPWKSVIDLLRSDGQIDVFGDRGPLAKSSRLIDESIRSKAAVLKLLADGH